MALGIFIAGVMLVILALSYDYYRYLRSRKRTQMTLSSCDANLNDMRIANIAMQDELSDLKLKLQNTFVDPVTNLLGWQLFEDRVHQALKESERHHFTMGLAMVDIDEFKTINDALGYEVGDLVLKEVAARLNECVREVDNVSRLTKDTFVIMLTQLSKPETAAIVAQRVLQSLAMPIQMGDKEINVTACIGVALFPVDAHDVHTLLSRADHALYLAKLKGRQMCQFYEENMQVQSIRELHFANALSREEYFNVFSLLLQPILNANNQELYCVEASLAWEHSEMGTIAHDEIIYHADKHRTLNALSLWMFTKACGEFKKLQQNGMTSAMLAIPLSVKQLENSQFIYEISQILKQHAFKPEWLLIELNPHMTEISYDILQKAFNMLHYLGVKIVINHFGSHSLSLRYLNAMKVNFLKLDTMLLDDMVENSDTRNLLNAIQHFATELSIQVIASGVLQKSQVEVLSACGVRYMQGDFFCKALSAEEMEAKLARIEA